MIDRVITLALLVALILLNFAPMALCVWLAYLLNQYAEPRSRRQRWRHRK